MQKRNVLSSPRLTQLRRKRKRAFRIKFSIFFMAGVLVLVGLSFATRINKLNIDKVMVEGNKVVETEDLEQEIKNDLSGRYFWLFPRTNFLIYPKNKIRNDLANKFKRVKKVSFNVENFKTLHVSIEEYEGKYLWCGIVIPVLNNNVEQKCYFMDSGGYIFDEAPYFSGQVYFKFFGGINLQKEDPSGNYFAPEYFGKIITLKDNMEKMNLKPTSFWFESQDEVDISLAGEPSMSPRVIFKIDSDYQKLTENLQAAISTEPLQTELKDKFYSLQYIDLRFGNKVYYRFK